MKTANMQRLGTYMRVGTELLNGKGSNGISFAVHIVGRRMKSSTSRPNRVQYRYPQARKWVAFVRLKDRRRTLVLE